MQLNPLLRKIHGSESHIGKMPAMPSSKKEAVQNKTELLDELKAKLARAIKFEEFEQAARLRDQIRALERKKK